jgi:hypothetical protein
MSSQTTLTENADFILDTTCSFRHQRRSQPNWPPHASLRMDCRPEVGPDLVADVRCLPMRNGVVKEHYCDPPHMIRSGKTGWSPTHDVIFIKKMRARRRKTGRLSPDEFSRYSWFNSRAEMDDFFDRALPELRRTLRPGGLVHFKLTESPKDRRYIKMDDFKARAARYFEVIKDKTTDSKSNFPNGNKVHWLTMKAVENTKGRDA